MLLLLWLQCCYCCCCCIFAHDADCCVLTVGVIVPTQLLVVGVLCVAIVAVKTAAVSAGSLCSNRIAAHG